MRHFMNEILMPALPFASEPGNLKWCQSPRPDVSERALIRVEDIWGFFKISFDFISTKIAQMILKPHSSATLT